MSQVSPVAEQITALQQADSAQDLLRATQELAASADASAAPVLVEVLGFNNPGAAVAAVEGLISLGTAAVRALAGIGDVRGLELLLDALGSDVAASVRRAAAKGLGQLQLTELPPDQQQDVQHQCLGALLAATSDGEWVVRYAVAVGLELLAAGLPAAGPERQLAEQGLLTLQEAAAGSPPVVQRRAKLALSRLGLQ